MPEWCTSLQQVYFGEVNAVFVPRATYFPQFGIVTDEEHRVMGSSFAEAQYYLGDTEDNEFSRLLERASKSKRKKAVLDYPAVPPLVALPWGALHNYGHFLIDGMSSVVAWSQVFGEQSAVLYTPPLRAWQSEILDAFTRRSKNLTLQRTELEYMHLDGVFFFDIMDHFLQKSTNIVTGVRERLLEEFKATDGRRIARKLYIKRNNEQKRYFLNEEEIMEFLEAQGFEVISPEMWSVREQAAIFGSADIVVGNGAALANSLFCCPGTVVLEIQPHHAQSIWVRNLCLHLGLKWAPFFTPSRLSDNIIVVGGVERPEIGIRFNVDREHFGSHLRQAYS